jgi:hypothetical protein
MDTKKSTAIALGKIEIHVDVYKGIVPKTVQSFSELHDYVDANEYAGLCDVYENESLEFKLDVQNELDEWVKGGMN